MADLAENARRKAQGKTPAAISPLALEAVRRIDALFDIERTINGQSAERRRAIRQELSAPLARSQVSRASTSGRLYSWRTRLRSSGDLPLISRVARQSG
jgi:hypothetical protein